MFNFTKKEPHGVVGAITPWNVPILLSSWKLAPALAAGNAFVHKPSEQTPVSALRLAELIAEETDMPDGIYNVVPGYGGDAGASLTSHAGVDKVALPEVRPSDERSPPPRAVTCPPCRSNSAARTQTSSSRVRISKTPSTA